MKRLLLLLLVTLGASSGQTLALERMVLVRYNRGADFGWAKAMVFTGEKGARIIAFSQARHDKMAATAIPSAVVTVYQKEEGDDSWLLDSHYYFHSDEVVKATTTKSSNSEFLRFLSTFKEYKEQQREAYPDVNDPSEPDPFEKGK